MANIVLGAATAHTPLLILPPELWIDFAATDYSHPALVFPPNGHAISYDRALAEVVPQEIQDKLGDLATFTRQYETTQRALDDLQQSIEEAEPDVVVIISDDQGEWFYDNNMPSLGVYWGDTAPLVPRPKPTAGTELQKKMAQMVADGYCATRRDVPVHKELGRHVIEHLIENDFDISHMTYADATYGGRISHHTPTPDGGELDLTQEFAHRPVGLPHGYSFIIERLLPNLTAPILPIIQNTCYPPNAVTPRRCYQFGGALADAIAAWPEDLRVAVIASGGLSHFVVDEVIDREVIGALEARDADRLVNLPRERLRSATSESVNWVTLGAIMAKTELTMETLAYEPVYRTLAGTGAGLGHARWV